MWALLYAQGWALLGAQCWALLGVQCCALLGAQEETSRGVRQGGALQGVQRGEMWLGRSRRPA